MPRLSELIAKSNIACLSVQGDADISAITSDSRHAAVGTLFVAIAGAQGNGLAYVNDAVAQGASAILVPGLAHVNVSDDIAVVRVEDTRAAIAALAAVFYREKPSVLFAVTGTDGKTSTADFTRQLAQLLGHPAASIGTLGLRSPATAVNEQFPANNTSPEPVLLHKTLQQLARAGVTHVAMEASSHGLDQKRLDNVAFTAAAFTNLTRDHLDYHGTLERYAAAKARLFDSLLPAGATAVLNGDDAQFAALNSICAQRKILVKTFGRAANADYQIVSVAPHAHGLNAVLRLDGAEHAISLPLYGAFQLSNMLCAMGMLAASGIALEVMLPLLPQLSGVAGRLEKVAEKNGAPIFVDYAHTPAALENILKTLRPHTQNKLHVVFGCGGDRDAGKRPEMGRAAAHYADVVIVTDDNPRSEDPAAIRAAVLAGAQGATEIAGRDEAIRTAVNQLAAGDVLVVAGKGHETSQFVGKQVIHFSDAEHIREATR